MTEYKKVQSTIKPMETEFDEYSGYPRNNSNR